MVKAMEDGAAASWDIAMNFTEHLQMVATVLLDLSASGFLLLV